MIKTKLYLGSWTTLADIFLNQRNYHHCNGFLQSENLEMVN